MVFSATKRVMSSTWPWVSSPAQPLWSQMVWFDAEVVVEGLLEVLASGGFVAEAGVALLNFGEQALFGGEEDAGAVGVDAAAFEDEAVGLGVGVFGVGDDLGFELGDVVVSGDVLGDLVVAAPVVVLGPGVELPVGDGEVACGVFDEDGAGVAEPDAVGGPVVEVETGEVGSGAAEDGGGAVFGGESSLTRMWTSST